MPPRARRVSVASARPQAGPASAAPGYTLAWRSSPSSRSPVKRAGIGTRQSLIAHQLARNAFTTVHEHLDGDHDAGASHQTLHRDRTALAGAGRRTSTTAGSRRSRPTQSSPTSNDPVWPGAERCNNSSAASVDGPAISGTASGTRKGSPSSASVLRPPSTGEIIRRAMRKRMSTSDCSERRLSFSGADGQRGPRNPC